MGKISVKRQQPLKVRAILVRPICGSIYLFNPIKRRRYKYKCWKQNKQSKLMIKKVLKEIKDAV